MATKEEFLRELVKDERSLRAVFARVTEVVRMSFEDDRVGSIILLSVASPTEEEIRRRANICYDWFAKLRLDLHYSTQRALDVMPKALRSTLDGTPWEPPPAERAWAPPGPAKVTA